MIKLLDNTKISIFNYIYVFFVIAVLAGKATIFARSIGDIRTFGNGFCLLITAVFILSNRVRLSSNVFISSIIIFLLYAIATSINNRVVNPLWISNWIISLTMAYALCQVLKNRLFVIVETVLYHLCIIALIMWFLLIINPGLATSIVSFFEFSKPYTEDCNVAVNMIIYTINKDLDLTVDEEFYITTRNAGFAWEPGAFSCLICLGIFCNLLRTQSRFIRNNVLFVFLLTLLSCQSTTGIFVLMIMSVVWLMVNRSFSWVIILIPFIIWVYSLPFVGDKFLAEIELTSSLDFTKSNGGSYGRLYSLILDYQEFLRHPLLGLGGWVGGTWFAQQGYEFSTISGIGGLISQYGAIMTILFLMLLIRSCNLIRTIFNTKDAYILLAVIIGMMFSYSLWTTPLYLSFWLYGVYAKSQFSQAEYMSSVK